jgi:hypothetical protein
MRHTHPILAFVGALVLASATSATAQEGERKQPWNQAVDRNLTRDKDLSGKKLFDQAKTYVQKMQTSVRRDERKRAMAIEQKDLIKQNCLNDKLAQARAHLKEAEQSLSALAEAIERNDSVEKNHESSRIRIYQQKVMVLSAEAESCTGEDSSYVGPSKINVEIDATVPGGDPTDPGLPAPNFTMPPPGVEEAAPDSPFANQSGRDGTDNAKAHNPKQQ